MSNEPTKWHRRYMALARFWADTCSKDPTTKVGAVVIGTNRKQMSLGYNGFPPGIFDDPRRLGDRPTKHRYTQHAERNALDNAEFDVRGGTLVCTLHPCVECTKSIISRGITRVVCPSPEGLHEPWLTEAVWAAAMMDEARVQRIICEPV